MYFRNLLNNIYVIFWLHLLRISLFPVVLLLPGGLYFIIISLSSV